MVGRLPLATKDCPVSNTSSLYCRFEGGGQAAVGNQGLSSCPALTAMGDTFSLSVALQWFDTLLAPLDCYTWAFGQGLLSPAHILSGTFMSYTIFI